MRAGGSVLYIFVTIYWLNVEGLAGVLDPSLLHKVVIGGNPARQLNAVLGGKPALQLKERIENKQVRWANNGGPQTQIVGGSNVNISDPDLHVPWQAGIRLVLWGSITVHHCGGTILAEYWVLTAAHCLPKNAANYKVRVGDLHNTYKEPDEAEFTISRIFKHPSFSQGTSGTYDYDIALVQIRPVNGRGIRFNLNVQPAYVPTASTTIIPQKNCFISGWGRTTDDLLGRGSSVLQVAKVSVLDKKGQTECNKQYRNLLTSRMICAGFLDGTKIDACSGDSGGPLVCKINGYNIVVGVTSWGTRQCAVKGYPGVYTNVQVLRSWLYNPTSV